MVTVVYGTTGELIKLSPLLTRLAQREEPSLTVCTGQHVQQIPALLKDFGLPQPNIWLSQGNNGRDLEQPSEIPRWLLNVGATFMHHRKKIRAHMSAPPTVPLVVVHGDTFTTVLGAMMGRSLRFPVAHIEAGMRSGDWRNPFPEELDRRLVAKLARIHFAPGPKAAENLGVMKARGQIVDTGANTIFDALMLARQDTLHLKLPPEPFGLVSLHRFELLGKPSAFREILELLREASRSKPILFVDHPVTASAISAHKLDSLFDDRFRRVPRQRYFQFVALLRASAFLVTDSGGSQQECAQLGHPCLIHRAATEHAEGLGSTAVLSRMDLDIARAFLMSPPAHTESSTARRHFPTDVIVAHLESRGHLSSPATRHQRRSQEALVHDR